MRYPSLERAVLSTLLMSPLFACSGLGDNIATMPSGGNANMGGSSNEGPPSGGSLANGGSADTTRGGNSSASSTTSVPANDTGGSPQNAGGVGNGGDPGSGGSSPAGGTRANGGTTSAGGTRANGGMVVNAGGTRASGGTTARGGMTSAGGRAAGGTRASGGATAGGASNAGGAATAGTGPDCSGGPLATSVPNCVIVPPPSTGDYHQDCVDTINKIRWDCMCLPPLQRWTEGEACADQMAVYDSGQNSAHAGFIAKLCTPGGSAQCECPGWGSVSSITQGTSRMESCLSMMWHEVDTPSGEQGHYRAMSNSTYTRVACGINGSTTSVWALQNYSR